MSPSTRAEQAEVTPFSEPPESQRRPLPSLSLDDGTHAVVRDRGLEIHDAAGRLLVRFADGCATIEAPAGDLTFSAPKGRVTLRSGEDVVIEAARTASIEAKTLRAKGEKAELVGGDVSVVARTILTSAEEIAEKAARIERTAGRLIEHARDVFWEVTGLSQSRLGRVRTLVRDGYSLRAKRTTMVSEDDTSIDGKRILLG